MIVAFVAFVLAMLQALFEKQIISSQKRFIFSIVVAILSGIPLAIQFVILSGELALAGKYSIKLILHRMMMNVLGEYGPLSNLIFKQYRQKKFGEYRGAKGLHWRGILYVGHVLAKVFGAFAFGDAFSGVFTYRYTSIALWMEDECKTWVGCEKPVIENPIFETSHVITKDVRDLSLTAKFSPTYAEQSEMIQCDVFATGSRDSVLSKMYSETWREECPIENAVELCVLMKTLNNDSFIVKCNPPTKNRSKFAACEELDYIVQSILKDNKKVNARGVQSMVYV